MINDTINLPGLLMEISNCRLMYTRNYFYFTMNTGTSIRLVRRIIFIIEFYNRPWHISTPFLFTYHFITNRTFDCSHTQTPWWLYNLSNISDCSLALMNLLLSLPLLYKTFQTKLISTTFYTQIMLRIKANGTAINKYFHLVFFKRACYWIIIVLVHFFSLWFWWKKNERKRRKKGSRKKNTQTVSLQKKMITVRHPLWCIYRQIKSKLFLCGIIYALNLHSHSPFLWMFVLCRQVLWCLYKNRVWISM